MHRYKKHKVHRNQIHRYKIRTQIQWYKIHKHHILRYKMHNEHRCTDTRHTRYTDTRHKMQHTQTHDRQLQDTRGNRCTDTRYTGCTDTRYTKCTDGKYAHAQMLASKASGPPRGGGDAGCTGRVCAGIVGFPWARIKIVWVGLTLLSAWRTLNASQQNIWASLQAGSISSESLTWLDFLLLVGPARLFFFFSFSEPARLLIL